MNNVIVVASGKGGTGKSTVCICLSVALVKQNKKVLLIDCDCGMRGLDIMLDLEQDIIFDASDAVCGNCAFEEAVYKSRNNDNLYLMAAPFDAENELSPSVFKQLVNSLKDSYDYVIIDAPAGIGSPFITAATPADRALIVTNAEPTSVRGAVKVRRKLESLGLENIRLVVNRFDKKIFYQQNFYEDQFWRRWHISLSTWFKEYVYIPLGGNRKGVKRQIINLLIVWGLTGLWHGASWNFLLWGLYYGILLILEKFVLKKYLDKLPSALQHVYTILVVIIGWALFYFTDMSQLGEFFVSLVNFSDGIFSQQALNLTISYLPILVAAIIASTPIGAKLYAKTADKKWMWIAETLFCILVLFISTASLVDQSYNPFLYFRF